MSQRVRLWLLALGALAGMLMAATGLVERLPSGGLPDHAVARVGERLIPRERYLELLSDLETDKRAALTDDDRRFALDRLVDEELLIHRGIELGLAQRSPEIRKAIAASVIAQLAAEAGAEPPGEAALRRIYTDDPEFFTRPARYRAHWWVLAASGADAEPRAAALAEALPRSGATGATLREAGFARERALPDALLPMTKLADYLGPDLARRLESLAPGGTTGPVATGGAIHVLQLLERQPERLAPFAESRTALEAEHRRRSADRALREYLEWLRQRTPVVIDSGAVTGAE